MNRIEQIIFDILASGGGVTLPGTGSIYVEREPAEFISKREIKPPHNRVLYSKKEDVYEPVTDLLQTGGTDREEVVTEYTQWLESSTNSMGVIEINGVGILKSNSFYPSVALHDALNPLAETSVAVGKKGGTGNRVLVILLILISAVVVLFFVIALDRYLHSRRPAKARTEQTVQDDNRQEQHATGEAVPEGSVEDAIQKQLEDYAQSSSGDTPAGGDSNASAAAAQQAGQTAAGRPDTEAGQATADVATYHLIAGVFGVESNADKVIAADKFGIGQQAYRKLPDGKGKTMVAIYSSTDRDAVEKRRRELRGVDPAIWVYREGR